MSFRFGLAPQIDLCVKGRISPEDAARQSRTAAAILARLADQPGVILADEVGMGKTFVALAVAASVALGDREKRPVVVMVPSALKEKWPKDFDVFKTSCLPPELREKFRCRSADRAVDLLKLVDDPAHRRASVIFLTHGAMSLGLQDGWVKLALIQRSLYRRWSSDEIKAKLSKCLGGLLGMKWVEKADDSIWGKLLDAKPTEWLRILQRHGIDPEHRGKPEDADDPVPAAVLDVMLDVDARPIFEALENLPQRQSTNWDDRVKAARRAIDAGARDVWEQCMQRVKLRLPLLILDEAHHLKNGRTRLASLFHEQSGQDMATLNVRGRLQGMFDRMLFLTATPFQLGHDELCSVLERFAGVNWRRAQGRFEGPEAFLKTIEALRARLDAFQEASARLENAWSKLDGREVRGFQEGQAAEQDWWLHILSHSEPPPEFHSILDRYRLAEKRMLDAQEALRPWVIRHLRSRKLPEPFPDIARRNRISGNGITKPGESGPDQSISGLPVHGKAILPFLLAVRATSCNPESRPVFAEGLASSFEAFLHTRVPEGESQALDDDDEPGTVTAKSDLADWYLNMLDSHIPRGDLSASRQHPKISATIAKAMELWARGEKVLIFCHYIATGKILRQHLSHAIREVTLAQASAKMGCVKEDAWSRLEKISARFDKADESPLGRGFEKTLSAIFDRYPGLGESRQLAEEVFRRFVRTPSFLVRFFPLERVLLDESTVEAAFASMDASGMTLRDLSENFIRFLAEMASSDERMHFLEAARHIQPGSMRAEDAAGAFAEDEGRGTSGEALMPNVRLVNGATKQDTRRRLMVGFNTPFFPDILIASSVMAEGVDLHLNCRHIIHHDLCWNPSTLEQRTGRVDRIGAKIEKCGKPIQVYLPFIGETQDEKMYRVVLDRERWFSVLMGENYRMDAWSVEKTSNRVPLPESAAAALQFRLEA